MAGATALAVGAFLMHAPRSLAWAATVTAILIVWKHRANVRRLAAGTERRVGARPAAVP